MPFAIHPYRTIIQRSHNAKTLKHTIVTLSNRHGPYVNIQAHSRKTMKITCGNKKEYLLGETIWHALGKPTNMIYCEELPYQKLALLIIVHDGHVYLDSKIPIAELTSELLPIRQTNRRYAIFLHGELPINQTSTQEDLTFAPKNVQLCQVLNQSVLCEIRPIAKYQLECPIQAIKSATEHPFKKLLTSLSLLRPISTPAYP